MVVLSILSLRSIVIVIRNTTSHGQSQSLSSSTYRLVYTVEVEASRGASRWKIEIDTLSITRTSAKIGQTLPTPGLGNGRLPSSSSTFAALIYNSTRRRRRHHLYAIMPTRYAGYVC